MMSTSTSVIGTVSTSSAFPIRRPQPRMDILLDRDLTGNVLWEEDHSVPSIMDVLIPISSLSMSHIQKIAYSNGQPIFTSRPSNKWVLENDEKKQTKRKKKVARNDVDELTESSTMSIMPDNGEETWSARAYRPNKEAKKAPPRKRSTEQQWAGLFNTVYISMHSLYKATFSTIPQCSSDFPFLPEAGNRRPHRWWSAEFSTSAIPDETNAQKPDIVLINHKVQAKSWAHVLTCIELTVSDLGTTRDLALFKGAVTKGYLMIREQPWRRFIVLFSIAVWQLRAHYIDRSGLIITRPISIIDQPVRLVNTLNTLSLVNCQAHGMDPTIHLCDDICKGQHSDLANRAIGWVEDKRKDILLIMAILWRSQGLFSRGTICYRIQNGKGDEYALKDCWVDEDKKNHEEDVLNHVQGIPNVVTLIEAWDVEYQNEPDSTLCIRDHHGASRSIAFRSHETMLTVHVLHRDLSPNNFIIHKGSGYFIDFDHAQIILPGNTSVRSRGTGTLPYMSIRLLTACAEKEKTQGTVTIEHCPSDDIKSLFYIFVEFISTYDGPQGYISNSKVERWAETLEDMGHRAGPYKSGLVLITRHDKQLMNRTTQYFGGIRDLVQEWHLKFFYTAEEQTTITHLEILELIKKWISHEAVDEPLPPTQEADLSSTTHPRRSTRKVIPVKRA
ncbi:uncharacterized protein F5147DRAFT_780810 [Suillus discolor]|uniref:Protein kinase domain-containing protein n=1 Tax=Suillus discolor TaxID=1912936 RepID=A0A9P7ETW4_9AGAM|nr:uncharacterized protein F5147DRAFT_780810 [Suillus discolor]KAG2088930.1 hypothetical protein F5147DRAFT_780810 [Suillus discolor]